MKTATDDAAALAKRFKDVQREKMAQLVVRLRTQIGGRSETHAELPVAGEAAGSAFGMAKDLVADCITAATNAFEDDEPEVLSAFLAGNKIGQSFSRLDEKITALIPLVHTHDLMLAEWGEENLEARLKTAQEQLRTANADQEAAIKAQPSKTVQRYETQGRLFGHIKKRDCPTRPAGEGMLKWQGAESDL